MKSARALVLALAALALGCPSNQTPPARDGGAPIDGGASASDGGVSCKACATSDDCGDAAECVQYAQDDRCAATCATDTDCDVDDVCLPSTSFDGRQVSVCVPRTGGCDEDVGCGTCPEGTTCDVVMAQCVPNVDAGTLSPDAGEVCPGYDPPAASSCCRSCAPGSSRCQQNGCYGGWWCESSSCQCHAPPTQCAALPDGGAQRPDAGAPRPDGGTPQPDAGTPPPVDAGPPTGSVGPTGGTVNRLYFAIVGDTRPPNIDDTRAYPSAVIQRIYADVAALRPQPQFVVTTGDYMFASPSRTESTTQIQLYTQASRQFSGPIFAAMGNHECTGATDGNCAGAPTRNMQAFMDALVRPLGQSKPYYSIPINAADGAWTAKFVITACNAWDATQSSWLSSELARTTTFTFVVRHEPAAATQAPCVREMTQILSRTPPTLLLVGHTHTFEVIGHELVVGNGGAPLTGSASYGFVTLEQRPDNRFDVRLYDYMTALPVRSYTLP